MKLDIKIVFDIIDRSPLMRGRGLKHLITYSPIDVCKVAPHAGAWIETEMVIFKWL